MPRKVKLGGVEFDPSNVSGQQLANIGRWSLTGKALVDEHRGIEEGDYTHLGWLDMRVDEICKKGQL